MSTGKTQVTVFHRKKIRTRPILKVEETNITAGKSCEFLGVILDKRLTLRDQIKKIEKEVQKRTKIFAGITGSHGKPRADTDLSVKILKSMIQPVTTYAPSLLCMAESRQLLKVDQTLRNAARLAIHAPKGTRSEYVYSETGLTNTETTVTKLAKKYILDPKRSESVREVISTHTPRKNTGIRTPLDSILS